MPVRVNVDNFDAEVLSCETPVVVDFYSDSCVPCKKLSPILAELEAGSNGAFKLCKVNAAASEALTEAYGVQSAPTLLFFKGGTPRERQGGFIAKEPLQEIINRLLEAEE